MNTPRPLGHLLRFVVIGTALFVAERTLPPRCPTSGAKASASPRPRLEITSAQVDELRHGWLTATGHLPTHAELSWLLAQAIDDELLYREALRRGLDRHDSVVHRRLIQNMRFVSGSAGDNASELYRDAIALGMDRSDLVVRRRLIERMQLRIQAAAYEHQPTDAELQAYLDHHPDQFVAPARVHLSQIFLSRARRGNSLAADAKRLQARLIATDPHQVSPLGDPLPLPRELPLQSERELAKLFGPAFAAAAMKLPVGVWSGPVASTFGLHLVFVHESVPAAPRSLAEVRSQVRETLLADRARQRRRRFLRHLRARYDVNVGHTP